MLVCKKVFQTIKLGWNVCITMYLGFEMRETIIM